jgi:hypothetical protein
MTNDNKALTIGADLSETTRELEATRAMLEVTRMDLEQWGNTVNTLTSRLANALDTIERLENLREGADEATEFWRTKYEILEARHFDLIAQKETA